jgi:hypothetical protein
MIQKKLGSCVDVLPFLCKLQYGLTYDPNRVKWISTVAIHPSIILEVLILTGKLLYQRGFTLIDTPCGDVDCRGSFNGQQCIQKGMLSIPHKKNLMTAFFVNKISLTLKQNL